MTRFLIIAGMATALLIQSSFAQTADQAAQTEMDKAMAAMGIRSQSGSTDRIDAAMTNPNPPPTENDKKAAAAMRR
jgi:hypothetical protein